MGSAIYRFDDFLLDPAQRQLRRGEALVELNSRYLDALALLLREQGQLVSKERFLDEVWNGIPVTEEALTQCIRTLRRQLGDSVASPRYIETVPKHGYRFIAPVDMGAAPVGVGAAQAATALAGPFNFPFRDTLMLTAAGTTGAGVAGALGGLLYGFAAASHTPPASGAVSMVLVVACLSILVALAGGAGVSAGIAAATRLPGGGFRWAIAGGAIGGLLVGGVVKLLGLDAFTLLLGRSPGDITGAMEGLLLGGAVGFGTWFGARGTPGAPLHRNSIGAAAAAGAVAGAVIPLLGGKLMAGSLDLLARSFPDSRLRLDPLGRVFGDNGFGLAAQVATGALEGALFAACIVGAMVLFAPLLAPRERA